MRWSFVVLLVAVHLCSCSSMKGQSAVPGPGGAGTMSCIVEGQIVKILNTRDADKKSLCAKYPCRAMVRITNIYGRGPGVSIAANAGDTIEMNFAYTLMNTRRIFPAMKTRYPGLKKGQQFSARAEQRLRPGTEGEFVVYGYNRK